MQPKPVAPRESPKGKPAKKLQAPKPLSIALNTPPEIATQLKQLQQAFADVCNAIEPTVRATRCWNRVALHHLVYHRLRQCFPQLGSQMICNAIYSVSRVCRPIFQTPASPFNITRIGERPLPKMRFASHAPVYFDRHTLTIRDGIVSILTLEGRARFHLSISDADQQRLRQQRVREIQLINQDDGFLLRFVFSTSDSKSSGALKRGQAAYAELPNYVALDDTASTNQVIEVQELGEVV